jgi:hypothetical protein
VHWIKRWITEIEDRMTAIERAREVGTLNAADRSLQYTKVSNGELLRAVNEAWTKIRTCEKQLQAKEQDIANLRKLLTRYRWMNIALTSIITGLAWEGIKALVTILK